MNAFTVRLIDQQLAPVFYLYSKVWHYGYIIFKHISKQITKRSTYEILTYFYSNINFENLCFGITRPVTHWDRKDSKDIEAAVAVVFPGQDNLMKLNHFWLILNSVILILLYPLTLNALEPTFHLAIYS